MRILLIRFSAFGDIILTLPVIQKLKAQYPKAEITLVSRPYISSLAEALEIDFFGADIDVKYNGFAGLVKLSKHLHKQYNPTHVIDLHNVLRTKIIRNYFSLNGVKGSYLIKDRKAQKHLTQYPDKELKKLPHITKRYQNTINAAGIILDFNPLEDHLLKPKAELPIKITSALNTRKKNIGLAPFSQHKSKQWPVTKIVTLINSLTADDYTIWLFGGKGDIPELNSLKEQLHADTEIIAGILCLPQEILLMSKLDSVIAMDSSNMHMAAVSGTKVISIWGATHPFAGYAPLGHNDQGIIQIPDSQIDCRPCSVYGQKPCFRADHACMEYISPEKVKEKL